MGRLVPIYWAALRSSGTGSRRRTDGNFTMVDSVLNVDGAARLLGVSHDTIYRLAREATIPCQKVGSQWRFSRAALFAWVRHGVAKETVPSPVLVDSPHDVAPLDDPSVRERPSQPGSRISKE